MVNICVAGISAVLEPSTAASATAAFAKFLSHTALETYGATRVDDGHHLA